MPKMYEDLASWWPLLSAPEDYAEESAFYARRLIEACDCPPRCVLELGSGGGNNASHLKARFDMVLVDRSPGMLAVSRLLNPGCEHVEGDMRTVRLGREFDAVFVHDAICYMTDRADVRQAIGTAFVDTRPGGAAVFAHGHLRETFQPSTDHGGHDRDGRGLRYLEWTWDPDPRTPPTSSTTPSCFAPRTAPFAPSTIVISKACSPAPNGCTSSPRPASTRAPCDSIIRSWSRL